MSTIEERLHRFDDVFRTIISVIAFTLSFGLAFFRDLGIPFFGRLFAFLIVVFSLWGVGHLHRGKWEVTIKLLAWNIFSNVPGFVAVFLYPIAVEEGKYLPPLIGIPVIILDFFIYLGVFCYLGDGLEEWLRPWFFLIPSLLMFMYLATYLSLPLEEFYT